MKKLEELSMEELLIGLERYMKEQGEANGMLHASIDIPDDIINHETTIKILSKDITQSCVMRLIRAMYKYYDKDDLDKGNIGYIRNVFTDTYNFIHNMEYVLNITIGGDFEWALEVFYDSYRELQYIYRDFNNLYDNMSNWNKNKMWKGCEDKKLGDLLGKAYINRKSLAAE